MTSKKAYHITRKFKHNGIYKRPKLLEKWFFYFFNLKDELNLSCHEYGMNFYFTNKKFDKLFKDIPLEDPIQVEEGNHYTNVIGRYAMTSIGLVKEEDFLLAEDILENTPKIKKKDLIIGNRYKSILGKEYIYLDSIEYALFNVPFLNSEYLLYDIKRKKRVNLSSIHLVEEIENNDIFDIIIFSENIPTNIGYSVTTKIKNINFM